MPNPKIKRITMPSGNIYEITDSAAWQAIEELRAIVSGVMHYRGATTTPLTDGATTSPIIIDGDEYTPQSGDVVTYKAPGSDRELEFAWNGSHWSEYGSSGTLKALAFKDTATTTLDDYAYGAVSTFTGTQETFDITPAGTISVATATTTDKSTTVAPAQSGDATYTPSGSVSTPNVTLKTAGATTVLKNPTSQQVTTGIVTAAPGETAPANAVVCYSVTGETLNLYQIGYNLGDSITTENVTVKSGDAEYEASTPTFTGDGVRLETDEILVPETYSGSFTGTQAEIDYTPQGGVTTNLTTGDKIVTVS